MATVTISSGDAIQFDATMTIASTTSDIYATITGTTQIISFDLSALGSSPVIRTVSLQYFSIYSTKDYFYLTAPYKLSGRLPSSTPATLNMLKEYMTEDTLSLSIKYNGRPGETHNVAAGKQYRFSTYASFKLIVELESEPVFDSRSSGSLSATSVDFGQNITFNIEPFRDTYRHQIIYSVGNYIGRSEMLNAGVTSCTFSPPLVWMTEVPNSDTGTMKVLLDTLRPVDANDPNTTYTSVGTKEYNVQVKVPSNLYPTISNAHFEIVNPSALPQNRVFTGVTRIKITLDSISGTTGASIASIRYSGWGDTVTTTNPQSLTNIVLTTNVVRATGSITILVDITDSRGRSIGIGFDMGQAIRYNQPSLTIVTCKRCTPAGQDQDRGTAVKVETTFKCDAQAVAGNTARAYVYIRPEQGAWSNGFALTSGTERILTETDLGYELSHETHYEVRFVVEDNVMTIAGNMAVELYRRLPALQFALYFANNGRAIGIGKQADALETGQNGRLDINPNWTVSMGTDVNIGSQTLAEYIQSIVSAMQGS